MAFKIGAVYRITNRYLEIIHDKDIFSKPISSGNGLHIVGMLNSYVSIPLFNSQNAIGIIFEQLEPSKEREVLFSPKSNVIISKIRLIGTFNPINNSFKRGIDFFPTLDADVFTVEEKQLESIYNSTIKANSATLQIGSDIYFNQVNINADPNILFGKHCAVFGNTGSGKSCTVTSILQGVYLEKNRLLNTNNKHLKTIIIDSNEEYSGIFNDENGQPSWVVLKDYSDLELSHKDLSFYELTQLLKEDSPNVIPYLKSAVKILKGVENVDEKIYYEFSQLQIEIENAVPLIDNRGRMVPDTFTIGFLKHIIMRIKHFSSDERFNAVFNKAGNSIEDFLNSETETVLILSLRVANDILALLVYMISKSIFNYKSNALNREKDNILFVLEEAHRYISTSSTDQINNYYIDKLAREGRKFGVNLMVSTQRPSEVSNTVISQCNSLIVHKITNNKDLEFIRNTIEYDDKSQIDLLTSLKQQQALVLGEAFAFSSLIKIADANPLPHSETPKIFTND
ncbi:ATP-binding protein [Flavobacterium psychrophilum]|uniref:ATP-binding protein n=1 Tax=Flavobacterium psychrophilum TaxID=96345 RepID=UPI001C8F78E7|nr:ATP-binding protein [Flavobacterium psychrophilum]EKT4498138.1 ATP-binding protein [Flavobacterium psychrophilum]EKT4551260.1 ATP-binding protein [Flavobacterium psychrophilum]ELM3649405.1 ATP-binding protein [Flavobacterium psychrophilum]ELM3670251.1 ATP-binding protein [Flavobacterium psychrophilum]ELM3724965.1 ATP-binding protein [Flavobacterium psychrophilum]